MDCGGRGGILGMAGVGRETSVVEVLLRSYVSFVRGLSKKMLVEQILVGMREA